MLHCLKMVKESYEKRPNTDFFLVWIREITDQKKLRTWTFHAVDEG